MGVFPCARLSFRTDTTGLPQGLTRDTYNRSGWHSLATWPSKSVYGGARTYAAMVRFTASHQLLPLRAPLICVIGCPALQATAADLNWQAARSVRPGWRW